MLSSTSLSLVYDIEWLEKTCLILSSDPSKATELLTLFRDSNNAINDCTNILNSNTSISNIGNDFKY